MFQRRCCIEILQNVSEYPFLDITLKSNGNLSHSITDLVKKAKKALFCIKSYTTSLNNLPVKVASNLFVIDFVLLTLIANCQLSQ
jgi:hypothetical protein